MHHPTKLGLLIALLIVSTGLAGCAQGTDDAIEMLTETREPTSIPQPTDTPEPTNTPEPTSTPEPTDMPEPAPIEAPADLSGDLWMLDSHLNSQGEPAGVLPDTEITIDFKDGQLNGNAGCNGYFASYEAAGGTITIGPVGSTRMACSEPEGVMEQELDYLTALQSASAYEITGDSLRLTGADGAVIATFTRGTGSDIVGVQWEWEHFSDAAGGDDIDVDDPTKYTLTLRPDGTYTVKADCNLSGGAYVLEGNNLTLQPGPTTLAECEPGSLYDEYLARLGEVVTFVLDEGRLVLNLKADAGNLVFTKGGVKITGITWQWTGLVETEPAAQSVVPDPENYTLVLRPDGTLDIKADCNKVGGSYTLTGDALTIELGPSTMAFCGEQSLDQQYLALLGNVEGIEGYSVEEGQLVLYLKADAGRMVLESAE